MPSSSSYNIPSFPSASKAPPLYYSIHYHSYFTPFHYSSHPLPLPPPVRSPPLVVSALVATLGTSHNRDDRALFIFHCYFSLYVRFSVPLFFLYCCFTFSLSHRSQPPLLVLFPLLSLLLSCSLPPSPPFNPLLSVPSLIFFSFFRSSPS